jgi:hypothetical protein
MNIEEVRQRILKRDPVFGKKCLEYFDSLNLEDISVPFNIPNEATVTIRGTKKVDKQNEHSSLTDFIYEVGFITSKHCCLGVEFGRYNQKRSPYQAFVTEKEGIVFSAMPTPLSLMSYLPKDRLKEDLTFLEELIKTINGLGIK